MVKKALIALALVGMSSMAHAQDAKPYLTVTGEGRVMGTPDMARFTVGVRTGAETAAEAMAQNSAQMTKLLDGLKEAGLGPDQIKTYNISINPDYDKGYISSKSDSAVGSYTALNLVEVSVYDLPKLGEILDISMTKGANDLGSLDFALKDPRPAEDEARALAVTDARARAEVLAKAAGKTLGDIVSITEGGVSGGPYVSVMRASSDMPPVAAGQVATTLSVSVVFSLK